MPNSVKRFIVVPLPPRVKHYLDIDLLQLRDWLSFGVYFFSWLEESSNDKEVLQVTSRINYHSSSPPLFCGSVQIYSGIT
jgi:hypothetical protein